MNSHFENSGLLNQQGPQFPAIGIVPNNGLAIIAPLNDVVRVSGNSETRLAGHEQKRLGKTAV
jgi:hypothetical protein